MSVPSRLTKLRIGAVATVALLAGVAAAPTVAQSDEEGANDALESFWTAILESDFDAAAETIHRDDAARVVSSIREGGQGAVDLLGIMSTADEIVIGDVSDEELLTWFVETQFGSFPLLAEEITNPIELVGWVRTGDEGRAVLRANVPYDDVVVSGLMVQPTRLQEGEWMVLLPAHATLLAGLRPDTRAHDAGLTRETALIREFATAITEEAWSAAAGLVYSEDVERVGALARRFSRADDDGFQLDHIFGLDASQTKDMTDWDLTGAFLEKNNVTDFQGLWSAEALVCEGIVGDSDSDVLVYAATTQGGHQSFTLSVRDDDGAPWILIPSLDNWEAMAAADFDAP